MNYIFKFNIHNDIHNKTSIKEYIPNTKQHLLINDILYNTTLVNNNINNNNNNNINNYYKTNIKKYTLYNTAGEQTYTEFKIFLFHNNVLEFILINLTENLYKIPNIPYHINNFTSTGTFSNIKNIIYQFDKDGNYTIIAKTI
jgi:hypothetical protein